MAWQIQWRSSIQLCLLLIKIDTPCFSHLECNCSLRGIIKWPQLVLIVRLTLSKKVRLFSSHTFFYFQHHVLINLSNGRILIPPPQKKSSRSNKMGKKQNPTCLCNALFAQPKKKYTFQPDISMPTTEDKIQTRRSENFKSEIGSVKAETWPDPISRPNSK